MSSFCRTENRFKEGMRKNVYFLFQVNLKTPDATVETEEQYRTKVSNFELVIEIKILLQPRWRSGSRSRRS